MKKTLKKFLAFLLVSALMFNSLSALGPAIVKAADVDNTILNVKVVKSDGTPVNNAELFMESLDYPSYGSFKLGPTNADGVATLQLQYQMDGDFELKPAADSGFTCETPVDITLGVDSDWKTFVDTVGGEAYTGEVVLTVSGEAVVKPVISSVKAGKTSVSKDGESLSLTVVGENLPDTLYYTRHYNIVDEYGTFTSTVDYSGVEVAAAGTSTEKTIEVPIPAAAGTYASALSWKVKVGLSASECKTATSDIAIDGVEAPKTPELTAVTTSKDAVDTAGETITVTVTGTNLPDEVYYKVFYTCEEFSGDMSYEYTAKKIALTGTDTEKTFEVTIPAAADSMDTVTGWKVGVCLTQYGTYTKSELMSLAAPEAEGLVITEAFPDESFAGYVSDNFDLNADGILSEEEIAEAKIVDLSWEWYLTDTTGIEYLTEATEINLNYLEVESVDLSKNTKLEKLDIGQTYIETIDLSNNPELKVLKAQRSALTELDVTNNTKLETLNIENTRIAALDITKNTALKELVIDMSGVSTIDVSKNTKLEKLSLIGCSEIKKLSFPRSSAMKDLNISGTGLTSVSLSNCKSLESFKNYAIAKVYTHNFETGYGSYAAVEPAPLTSLDISKNTALKLLYLDGLKTANLNELDLTKHAALTKVSLIDTGLKSIKFNDSVAYEAIYLDKNGLKAADRPALTEGAKVEWGVQNAVAYDESEGAIETFNLGEYVDLARVTVAASDDIEYNAETGIITFKGESKTFAYQYSLEETGSYKMDVNVTVEKAPGVNISKSFPDAAFKKHVDKNYDTNKDGFLSPEEIAAVEKVDLTASWSIKDTTGLELFTEAKEINVNYLDSLTSIDVTKNTKLEKLDIGLTLIEEIDLSKNPELVEFKAQRASLKELDLSNNPKIAGVVQLENNQLSSINLAGCTEITKLVLDMSPLTELDVSGITKLEELTVIGCEGLTAIDTSNNAALKKLDITGTKISSVDLTNNVALETFNSYYRAKVLKKTHGTGNVNSGSYVETQPAPLSTLDLSKNTSLKNLILDGSDLDNFKDIDLTTLAPTLVKVSFENMGVTSIKFNDAVTYTTIYLANNSLKEADRPNIIETGAVVDWGVQNVTVKVPKNDPLETFDLNTILDITRAEVVASDDIEYNAETGIVTFKGENKAFAYKYSLEETGSYKMDVNVTVVNKTSEEEIAEMERPAAPASAKAVLSGAHNAVKFTWSEAEGAEGYLVSYKKAAAAKWSDAVDTTELSFVKKKLAAGAKYEFRVIPYVKYEEERVYDEAQAKVVTITTKKNVKAPTTVKAVLSGGYDDVKVSWTKSTGAAGYYVYMKKASASSYTRLGTTTKLNFVKKNLSDGVKYTFKVVPYYKNGDTKVKAFYSKTASVTTLKKLSVPKVTKVSSKKVKVSWTNIAGETGYQISRSTKKTGTNIVSTVKTTTGKTKQLTVTKGTKYYYKVRAYKTVDGKKIFGPWSNVKAYTLK